MPQRLLEIQAQRAAEDRELIHASQAGFKGHIAALEAQLDRARSTADVARADAAAQRDLVSELRAELAKAARNQKVLEAALASARTTLDAARADAAAGARDLAAELDAALADSANTRLLLDAKDRLVVEARAAYNVRVGELQDALDSATARMRAAEALGDPSKYVERARYEKLHARLDKAKRELAEWRSGARTTPRGAGPPSLAQLAASGSPTRLASPAPPPPASNTLGHSRRVVRASSGSPLKHPPFRAGVAGLSVATDLALYRSGSPSAGSPSAFSDRG